MTVWVGTYQEPGGHGLYPLTGISPLVVSGSIKAIANASFGAWSSRHQIAYVIDERADGMVRAWKHGHGTWSSVGEAPSGGSMPCYLSISQNGMWIAVANYDDGALGLIELDPTSGRPIRLVDVYQASGRGPDAERQDGPHAHCAIFTPDDAAIYHVDLGTDRIYRHEIGSSGIADTVVAFQAPPGSGPRHLLLLPDGQRALLICEMGARLLLLRHHGGAFACLDNVATLPEPCDENLGGHLTFGRDGSIYVTNRGHDSLVRFVIHGDKLVREDWWPTGGASPRHVLISDEGAIVAHEQDGGVTQLEWDRGLVSRAPIPGAAFLIDIPD